MNEYIECRDCDFVTLAASTSEPRPKKFDSCPGCGGSAFQFTASDEPTTD